MIEHEQHGATTPRLARTLGSKTGLCGEMTRYLPPRENPIGGVVIEGETPDLGTFLKNEETEVSVESLGKGQSIRDSVSTLLGETVERYVPYVTEPEYEEASYDELAADYEMVDSAYFQLFSQSIRDRAAEHFRELDILDESETRPWVAGTNLVTGEETYLPVEFVYGREKQDGWNWVIPTTSNGLACHETTVQSLLASIYEQVERDAFMETWFTQTPPVRLRADDFTTDTEGLEINVLKYQTGIDLPIVGCLGFLKKRETPKPFFCGGSAGTYHSAIQSMLWEAAQSVEFLSRYLVATDGDDIDPRAICNLEDNVLYYLDPENAGDLEFFLDGPSKSVDSVEVSETFATPEAELTHVVSRLESEGVTPVAFDLTTPDIEDLGLSVTKVIVPELLQLPLPSFPFDRHPKIEGRIQTQEPHPYP